METTEKAYLIRISGRVTGVGFRYYASRFASGIPGLKGYVRNAGYGRVETFIQGQPDALELMADWLRKGPPMAQVERFEMTDAEPDSNAGPFNIEI